MSCGHSSFEKFGKNVYDLYGGVGVIGILASDKAKQVIIVESSKDSKKYIVKIRIDVFHCSAHNTSTIDLIKRVSNTYPKSAYYLELIAKQRKVKCQNGY